MDFSNNTSFLRSPWLLGGLAAVAIFILCFVGINYISRQPEEKTPEIENVVIATTQTNPELIAVARQQGWIDASATEMTSIDASKVTDIDSIFVGSDLKSFDEFRYFVAVQEIKAGAFAHSDSLKHITIPSGVQDIKYGALAYCPNLETIEVDTANTHYDSRKGCNSIICSWKGHLMLVAGCRNSIVLPEVRFLAPQSFCGVHGMPSLAFPSRIIEIGEEAFKDCTDLLSIVIPKGVTIVEKGTFAGCTSLEEIVINKSVQRMKKNSFAGCSKLMLIKCPKVYPPHLESAFDIYQATVLVPKDVSDIYLQSFGWKNFPKFKEIY